MTFPSLGEKKLWFALMLWRSKDVFWMNLLFTSISFFANTVWCLSVNTVKCVDRYFEINNGSNGLGSEMGVVRYDPNE